MVGVAQQDCEASITKQNNAILCLTAEETSILSRIKTLHPLWALLRLFGGSTEGITIALIIMNLLAPLIEKLTLPKAFGSK